jgi:hypothetical protein
VIADPKPEDCETKQIVVRSISEGPSYDIIFHSDSNDFYYINRGLENGLELDALRDSLLNKSVNLHLANTLVGSSNHIAQLSVDGQVVYTEFD